MITQIRLKNFKSWAEPPPIRLAPLTGFFGANSSGKTSLLQMLLLLKQTTESADRNLVFRIGSEKDSLVDLGTVAEIIHNGQNALELGLGWKLSSPLRIPLPRSESETVTVNELNFTTKIHSSASGVYVDRLQYDAEGFETLLERRLDGNYAIKLSIKGQSPIRSVSRPAKYLSAVKAYGFSQEVLRYYQNTDFLSDLVLEFERLFQQVYYLGPLREYPHRVYNWGGEHPSDVGQKGELAIAALLAKGTEPVYRRRGNPQNNTLEAHIARWLQMMGLVHSFRTSAIREGGTQYELRIRRSEGSAEVLITDMGFGVSQILPILVLCYYAPEGSTLILEQPEIHLHPSVQSTLADVFIEVIQKRRLQLIVESHSEHFLRRLQRRIAEEKLRLDETALYFCEVEKGISFIRPLELDLFGNIRNWPPDFFGDLTGDLFEMAQAGIKRRMLDEQR